MSTASQTETIREKQVKAAEELLFAGPQKLGFAKGLFLGRFVSQWVMPYPRFPANQEPTVRAAVAEIKDFLDHRLDPVAIDRQADIPPEVIAELAPLGFLGMPAPADVGGRGFSQMAYGRVL